MLLIEIHNKGVNLKGTCKAQDIREKGLIKASSEETNIPINIKI